MSLEEEGVTSLKFLQTIYRNPEVPLPVRMKAAAIAIEYELPRLAVTAMVNSGDFGVQLDRAISRSRMIEAKPMIEGTATVSASDLTRPHVQTNGDGKPMIVDRRYRRW
jgi:hypothetical protein